jgi:hypothetical protein
MNGAATLRTPSCFALAILGSLAVTAPSHAAEHPCAPDAVLRGKNLLRFHVAEASSSNPVGDGTTATVLSQVGALKGQGKFDVLEVTSHIYKASYRMRFIYARVGGSCLLMGQEILEASNPY